MQPKLVWLKLVTRSPPVVTTSARPLFSLATSSSASVMVVPSASCSPAGVPRAVCAQPEQAVLARPAQQRRGLPLTVDVRDPGPDMEKH